jgi:predicted TPR repeat methyltransferase
MTLLTRIFGQFFSRKEPAQPFPGPVPPADAKERIIEGQKAEAAGRLEEALRCYQDGLAAFPDSAGLNHACGNVLRGLGRNGEAVAAYRKAVSLKPNAGAQNNLGVALCALGEDEEAGICFRAAIAIDRDHAEAYENLGGLLHGQGAHAESLECYRQVARLRPANGNARHMIAALTGENSERAPDEYVTKVFDGYSDKFEAHLVSDLNYRIPQQLVALIAKYTETGGRKFDALDLGCGTGLVGAELADRAQSLVGIDLSPKMLAQARAKNVYTRLIESDLSAAMHDEPESAYDVVTATDVFIYIGKIDDVVAQARRVLRTRGLFGFSVEAEGSQADYRLTSNGRYAQSPAYLARLAAEHGFIVRCCEAAAIREEQRVPVAGWLAVWQKP